MDDGRRSNQRRRTRKDLLQAAARLMQQGRTPSLEEIAAAAYVSRATAYRYFASAEAVMTEATLDMAVPEPEALLRDAPPDDPVARMERVEAMLHDMTRANETGLRMMLMNTLARRARGDGDETLPARQNRRSPLIEAALAPARAAFAPAQYALLCRALALVVGTEAMIVTKDVLQLDDDDARALTRWAIRALIDAARRASAPDGPVTPPAV
jgi:AcrR family transcriptional regulator